MCWDNMRLSQMRKYRQELLDKLDNQEITNEEFRKDLLALYELIEDKTIELLATEEPNVDDRDDFIRDIWNGFHDYIRKYYTATEILYKKEEKEYQEKLLKRKKSMESSPSGLPNE